MTWFRRGQQQPPAPAKPEEDEDSPAKLRTRLWALVQYVNRNAGRLPTRAVVVSRQITDILREVIETSDDRDLDVYAVVQINGIVGDYLPTTLRTYLNLDPALTDRLGPSGRTPKAALAEQLEALRSAAERLLHATQEHDVDALFTQGSFLRTKFTGSDLDL
jgi:hypothetical protein